MLLTNPDQPVDYGNARTAFSQMFGRRPSGKTVNSKGCIPMLNSRSPFPLSTPISSLPELLVNPRPSATASLFISRTVTNWYALWTRSRHEKVVRDQLIKKGIETFLPTVSKWSRWKDRRKKVEWPLFPGYCFAQFHEDQQLPVLTCIGVVTIVSFNGKPAPVADVELENLRRVVETDLAYDPCPLTKEGMMVEVVNGPLKGMVGRLVHKDARHAMVVLSVELINQAVRVEVEAADIRTK